MLHKSQKNRKGPEAGLGACSLHAVRFPSPVAMYSVHHLKGVLLYGCDDVSEEDLGGQCVAMVDNGLFIWTIPAVNLQTAAAFP